MEMEPVVGTCKRSLDDGHKGDGSLQKRPAKAPSEETNQQLVTVPLQGNAWCCEGGSITHKGLSKWTSFDAICKIYVYVNKPGSLKVGINFNPKGKATLRITILNESKILDAESEVEKQFFVGTWTDVPKGYLSIQLQGVSKSREKFGTASSLTLCGTCIDCFTCFVKNDDDNFFYWGRRGPSVHLTYEAPKKKIEWFYNEVVVPKGSDVIGSYFMSNGFQEGYFGMQVNSLTERRILFSVWSPHETDSPEEIPKDSKIILTKKGQDVYSGEFGNEGSGGQSYLVYPWKAETNYKFLLRAQPCEKSSITEFSGYFGVEENKEVCWRLIASFKRPKTVNYLKRLHSFLENFTPEFGDQGRTVYYDNQWVCDTDGCWTELTKAKFTGDNTAKKNFRKDYDGGIENGKFYLKNCGFFNESAKLNIVLERTKSTRSHPKIDFSNLP